MSYEQDPLRLSESASGAPEPVRELLVHARQDVPAAEQLARLAAVLAPLAVPAGTAATSAATGAAVAKAVGVALISGAVIAGGLWLASSGDQRAPAPASSSAAELRSAPAGAPSALPAATASQPSRAPEAAPSGIRDSAATAAKPRAAVAAQPSGPSEAELLAQAQAALRSNPAHALALTREHKRRFPGGVLAQEREVIAIEALSRLGREHEARGRADQFDKSYPGSAHRRKVGSSISDR
jgi:hypothetical protein